MSAIFGLDFGTSNSAISANINGEVQLINVDKNNPIQMSLKSVLYFYEEGTKRESYVGHEAVQKYIENEAEGRYMQSIKSFLTDQNFQHTEIFCKYYTLEKLISLILRTMKERAENQLKREIVDVVLGRPVVFSEDVEKDNLAQKRLTDAAKLAGFK
ncbi:Hsp70 family protein, partial [bacterium]|nr:Hsp70 family protein [bacterium]